jgi:pimeloyl-ACP methyl ester carboxylesterase
VTLSVLRQKEWAFPVRPALREVRKATPELDEGKPPVLFVPGFGHGAWVFAEHWLEHTADRGFPAYAMSLRGHGKSQPDPKATMRAYAHDVAQVAASLPRQAVIVAHGAGALAAAHALSRYAARAAVLLCPVFGGYGTALRNPFVCFPALFGKGLRLPPGQLFSREVPANVARGYARRLGRASSKAQWDLLRGKAPEDPVANPPVLVVGSPDDRIVHDSSVRKVARRYGGAPLLFPGMGHDMMLDARWREPIDAILDWLDKKPASGT